MKPLFGNPGPSPVSVILLVLVSSIAMLLLLADSDSDDMKKPNHETRVEPVSFLTSRLSSMLMAYSTALAYIRRSSTFEDLVSTIRWTWRRPAVTLLYIELLATAAASLLLMLSSLAKCTRGLAMEALLISSTAGLLSWLGPVLFAHSDAACKLSVVAAVVEEGCQGPAALERAGKLIGGRKLWGFSLSACLMVLEQGPFMVLNQKKVGCVVFFLVNIAAKFVAYFACTVFYYESTRNRDEGRGKGSSSKEKF